MRKRRCKLGFRRRAEPERQTEIEYDIGLEGIALEAREGNVEEVVEPNSGVNVEVRHEEHVVESGSEKVGMKKRVQNLMIVEEEKKKKKMMIVKLYVKIQLDIESSLI